MIVVVESLVNKLEEDQLKKEEMIREKQHCQSNSQYNDNCSDSDSSLNQVRLNRAHLKKKIKKNSILSISCQSGSTQ